MKRRYKEGDWFRVPLSAEHDALGLIARACRSRLFGYFFAIPAHAAPAHDYLRSRRAQDAAACALFGGAGLEDARWPLVATSLRFERDAWPFPQFASRGAFGRTWTIRTYDCNTMQAVRNDPSSEAQAADLPDARIANAEELETLLRERICGAAPAQPLAVVEMRSPLDQDALHVLSRGGRVQFSEPLPDAGLESIARCIAAHPSVELRVHAFERFDLRNLRRFHALRSLILDVQAVDGVESLADLPHLHTLRTGAAGILPALPRLPQLRLLEIRGGSPKIEARGLESLILVDTEPPQLSGLPCAQNLRELTLAHMAPALGDIAALPSLTRLELRDVALRELPDLSRNGNLQCIALRGVRHLRDLRPLARAAALRELRIENMPQLGVADFEPLAASTHLHVVHVDVGSRQKEREIYRLLRAKA